MNRSFCRALCALLGCVLLLGISACAKQDFASSEPPVETPQTEAIAETEESRGEKDIADETTSESINEYTEPDGTNTKERYIQNEDGTGEDFVEKWKDGQKQYDAHWVYDQNENPISMLEVMNDYDENGELVRILENNTVWNDDGSTTSTETADYFQDFEDYLKGYKTKQVTKAGANGTTTELIVEHTDPDGTYTKERSIQNEDGTQEDYVEKWKDGRKQYDGHWLYDQNENPISMQEVMYHYDEDGALIRILENEFIWNDDGGTTLINAAELFQDYEGSLKGYKVKQIKKDRADGTTYEFHGEYWYPDGRYSKAGFTTNANGARENYSEEWKDGKKVSK